MRRLLLASSFLCLIVGTAGCGGDDAESAPTTAAAPQSVDYELPQRSSIGLHQAFATFTEQDAESTSAVIEFSVERTDENSGLTYAVAIYGGSCDALGEVEREVGELPAGTNTSTIDAPYEDVVGGVEQGVSSIAIMEPDGETLAWCGPV